MRNLIGKIALTTGSALIAGGLLVIAYLSAGTFILAGILAAVFLIGEKIDVVQYVFAPIAFSAAIIFAAASWALTALGVGTWWVWKKSPRATSQPAASLAHRHRLLAVLAEHTASRRSSSPWRTRKPRPASLTDRPKARPSTVRSSSTRAFGSSGRLPPHVVGLLPDLPRPWPGRASPSPGR